MRTTPGTSFHATTRLVFAAALLTATGSGCTKRLAAAAEPPSRAAAPAGSATPEPDDPDLIQGPDLSSLPKEKPRKPGADVFHALLPFDSAGFLTSVRGRPVRGLVNFVDTVTGLRVVASIEGLEPGGVYELRADEFTYGAVEGVTCESAPKPEKSSQPVVWRLGPLKAGADGVARFDRIYPGIANTRGPYVVPVRPVMGPKVPRIKIDLREFFLGGRKLTLHRRKPAPENSTGDAVACAIIHGVPPFGVASIEPLAGTVKGEIVFQQGEDNRVTMEVKLTNLAPGSYRLVVHEFADCENATGTGVGEPYHPEDNPVVTQPDYGWPLKQGDLGTFTAGARGTISKTKVFNHPLTSGSPHIIRGRAIVVESVGAGSTTGKPTSLGCGMVTGF